MKKRIKLLAYALTTLLTMTSCKIISKQEIIEFKPTTSTTETTKVDDETNSPTQGTEQLIPESTEDTTVITDPTIETSPTIPETTPPVESIPNEEFISLPNEIVYATTEVNIRTGNNTDSLRIGNLSINESVIKLLSCDNNWDLVRTHDKIGYVCRDYLSYSNEFVEEDISHTLHNDIVLTTTELNFRSAPSQEAEKLDKFPKGAELDVIATTDNGWLLVKYNGVLGYVKKDYTISLLEKINYEDPELELTELEPVKIVYSNTTLNVRKGNSTEHEIITQLEKYESVRVLAEYEDWYLIMLNDYTFGYVSKEYTRDLQEDYIIVDKSEQRLYFYNNSELYYTTPVTTGKDSTPSDTGLFKIYSKETNRYLTDGKTYNAWVGYWMPYNGGEGLHDANWRTVFGNESYHYGGSHGCINIPPKITDEIFEQAKVGTKVLVHK